MRLLVQFTDGGGQHLAAPQILRNILYTPHGHACQIHLNKDFFHAALPTAILLNDGSLKGAALDLGTFKITSPDVVVRLRL